MTERMGSMETQRPDVNIVPRGTVEYGLYGEERERTGVAKVILEPVTERFEARVGEEVTYRVVAVHRETVER